jgi:hypothetical protein
VRGVRNDYGFPCKAAKSVGLSAASYPVSVNSAMGRARSAAEVRSTLPCPSRGSEPGLAVTDRAKLVAIALPLMVGVGLAVYGSQVDLDDDGVESEVVSGTEPRGPKWVGVSDNRGDPLVCPGETEPMRVPSDFKGPPHAIMEPVPPSMGSGAPAAVARCGPNGKPVWVPETLAGRVTAPRRYWGYVVRPVRGTPGYDGDWTGYAPLSTEKNQGDNGGEG